MANPVLVVGATGQIGRALCTVLGDKAVGLSRDALDLNDVNSIHAVLDNYTPLAIINAAAYTGVDKAEEERDVAMRINGEAPGIIASWCKQHNIPLIHYSTDYVFDGSGTQPHTEDDIPSPINHYGHTKLAGEQAIIASGCKHIILRTSWVYDHSGHNFVNTMLKLGAEREVLSIVTDQQGAPSNAHDLASMTLDILRKVLAVEPFASGTYHMCNLGQTSWFTFAETIFAQWLALGHDLAVKDVRPCKTSDYKTPAVRPINSRLSCEKLHATFDITPPTWQDALTRCLEKKHECN